MSEGAFARTSFARGPNRGTTGHGLPETWPGRAILSASRSRMTAVAEI